MRAALLLLALVACDEKKEEPKQSIAVTRCMTLCGDAGVAKYTEDGWNATTCECQVKR